MTAQVELKKFQAEMSSNGYSFFNREAFDLNSNEPCYIPESAEDFEDMYSRRDLLQLTKEFLEENPEWFEDKYNNPGNHSKEEYAKLMVVYMYNSLEWEAPETWLQQRLY